jgi:hypothetical protein
VRLALTAGEAHDNSSRANYCVGSSQDQCCWPIVAMMPTGSEPLPRGRARSQYPAEMQSQRADLLQPVSLSGPQFGRTVLQQDQALSGVATRYDKLAANYLAFVQLASIRLWLRVNESRVLAFRSCNVASKQV